VCGELVGLGAAGALVERELGEQLGAVLQVVVDVAGELGGLLAGLAAYGVGRAPQVVGDDRGAVAAELAVEVALGELARAAGLEGDRERLL